MCVDRRVERVDDADREDRRQVFGVPVVLGRRLHRRNERARRVVAAQLDALAGVDPRQRRQHARGDALVHQQRLHRVARPVALRLGVVGDADRHVDVGVLVDEHVTDAVEVLDHRHRRFAATRWIRLLPPRGTITSTCVIVASSADGGAVGGRDRLHRVLGQAGGGEALVHACGDRLVGAHRLGAAAQDRRVARFEAQRGGVGGDVRPRFVDDADHAERHAHRPTWMPRRPVLELADLADGIGQRGDLAQARRPSPRSRAASSASRSTNASSSPAARAAATSSAFAASSALGVAAIAAAMASSAAFLRAASARARRTRAAARARSPTSRM